MQSFVGEVSLIRKQATLAFGRAFGEYSQWKVYRASVSPAPPAIKACWGMLPKLNAALGTWLRLDALVDLICDLNGLVLTGSAVCPRVVSSGHKYLD